jgi:hypothetical protein
LLEDDVEEEVKPTDKQQPRITFELNYSPSTSLGTKEEMYGKAEGPPSPESQFESKSEL